MRKYLTVIIIVLAFTGCRDKKSEVLRVESAPPVAAAESSSAPEMAAEEAVVVSAEKLYSEYAANEIAADSTYDGKVIVVSGVIRDFGKTSTWRDEEGRYAAYVSFPDPADTDGVRCVFKARNKGQLVNLSKGETVKIKGKCAGWDIGLVYVIDCELVQ